MFFNVFKPLLGDKEGFDGSQPRKIYLVPKSFDEVMDEPLRSSAIQMVEASKEVVIGLSFVTMNAIVGVHNDSSTIVKGKLCGNPTRLGHKQDGKKKKNGGKGMVERFIGLTRLDAQIPC